MKKKSRIITVLVLAAILGMGIFFAYGLWVQQAAEHYSVWTDLTNLGITMTSWMISLVALAVALITYFSIDSVNTLTSLEGNVLENENYTMAYRELVSSYDGCKNQAQLEVAVFDDVLNMLKQHSQTCMQFTDSIQYIIDHLLWFAYLDYSSETFKSRRAALISQLDKKMMRFDTLGNGTMYLLLENIKLVKNVLQYQNNRQNGRQGEHAEIDLLDIRARTIANPVAKTVYYDYLGLEYRSSAVKLLRDACPFDGDEFLPSNIRRIRQFDFKEKSAEIILYLQEATKAFDRATEFCGGDVLWDGYIRFNLARAQLLECLVCKRETADWRENLQSALISRQTVLYLFGGDRSAYLQQQFEKESLYAQTLQLCAKTADTDCTKEDLQLARRIEQACNAGTEQGIYRRIRGYLAEISAQENTVGK